MKPHLQHKHLLVRAEVTSPPLEMDNLDRMLEQLVKMIDMKILSGPHTAWCPVEGNMGWSGTVIIETSSITFHSWLEDHYPVIQLDVYSCKDFAVETVMQWLSRFNPTQVDYKFIDRETGFRTIEVNSKSLLTN
jgi:S-adenosylmethionine/arginine decarboxylase-like enzyme